MWCENAADTFAIRILPPTLAAGPAEVVHHYAGAWAADPVSVVVGGDQRLTALAPVAWLRPVSDVLAAFSADGPLGADRPHPTASAAGAKFTRKTTLAEGLADTDANTQPKAPTDSADELRILSLNRLRACREPLGRK
jgi:hypothetical protein